MNEGNHQIARSRVVKGARLKGTEDREVLTEFMDRSRCLATGLQNQRALDTVYQSYIEVGKKRNESISKRLEETLRPNEVGILFLREEHQVQFPAGTEVFYISPAALDEIGCWQRDHKSQKAQEPEATQRDKEEEK